MKLEAPLRQSCDRNIVKRRNISRTKERGEVEDVKVENKGKRRNRNESRIGFIDGIESRNKDGIEIGIGGRCKIKRELNIELKRGLKIECINV